MEGVLWSTQTPPPSSLVGATRVGPHGLWAPVCTCDTHIPLPSPPSIMQPLSLGSLTQCGAPCTAPASSAPDPTPVSLLCSSLLCSLGFCLSHRTPCPPGVPQHQLVDAALPMLHVHLASPPSCPLSVPCWGALVRGQAAEGTLA